MSLVLLLRGSTVTSRSRIREIPDALLGTGKKILVMESGRIHERVSTEGVPVVMVNGRLQLLASGEVLDS